MLFNSLEFIFFFLIVFIVYWIIPSKKVALRNVTLIVASYTFYGYWDWRFLGLIFLSTVVDFISGIQIEKSPSKQRKKLWLLISLLVNLGVLAFFKYFDFFVTGFAEVLGSVGLQPNISTLNLILPLGISFYTFQTISYTVDVYRGQIKPTRNFAQFAIFVSFFPQLVAGPIERAKQLLPQFSTGKKFSYTNAKKGGFLMLYGFFKKLVIADNLSSWVDPIYTDPSNFSGIEVLLGFLGFGVQVYADFSGYSDIAIGLAAIFGFHLNTNFKTPFFSVSIREFWTRWHISLYSWFRDYVYIPLGGSRNSKFRGSLNILITFGLSGLWHGAGWNYILFGLLHAIYYLLEKWYRNSLSPLFIGIIAHIMILLAWGVFRQTNFVLYKEMWKQVLYDTSFISFNWTISNFTIAIGLLILLFTEFFIRNKENFSSWVLGKRRLEQIAVFYLFIFWILLFGSFDTSQNFIYFQF